MNFVDIIRKKRDGYELTKEEIEFFAFSAADGSGCVPPIGGSGGAGRA